MKKTNKYNHKFKVANGGCWEWQGHTNAGGYGTQTVGSRKDNSRKTVLAHRLFYSLWYGEFDPKLCVLHKCDNPKCVYPEHLFLGTRMDNHTDMARKGRRVNHLGEKNGRSKLSDHDVRKIRLSLIVGEKQSDIARAYKVHQTLISAIKRGKIWSS
jgi:hypothetical protein